MMIEFVPPGRPWLVEYASMINGEWLPEQHYRLKRYAIRRCEELRENGYETRIINIKKKTD